MTTMKRPDVRPALCIALLASLLLSCGGGKGIRKDTSSETGTTLIETGELAAVTSTTFVMQRLGQRWNRARIAELTEHGKAVRAGDVVIKLDPSDITRYITDREKDLEAQQGALEKLLANQSNAQAQRELAIRSEEAAYELSKLSMQSVRFESERQQRIRQLQFRQATLNLERARRNREYNAIINENDLKIQQIRVSLTRKDVQRAYELLPQLNLTTPTDGIFQIERKHRRQPQLLNVGDEVNQGTTIARVPDLTWMKVNTYVHENDFLRVRPGQKVIVRLDALPGTEFPGEVASVGRLCHARDWNKPQVKVFDVEVRLLVSDERLKPGMTVSCEYK